MTDNLKEFLENDSEMIYSRYLANTGSNPVIFSGSFNPLHEGHLALANYVVDKLKLASPIFEVPIQSFGKSLLNKEKILEIENQFINLDRWVVFSKFQSFLSKLNIVHLRRNVVFIVGDDTLARINSPLYYNNSLLELKRVLTLFQKREVKFLVFPRDKIQSDKLHPYLLPQCRFIDDFEPINISSSQIRNEKENLK